LAAAAASKVAADKEGTVVQITAHKMAEATSAVSILASPLNRLHEAVAQNGETHSVFFMK